MKARSLCFFILFLIAFSFGLNLGAQNIHDPNSQIYSDIDIWFTRGYVRSFLPLIRPYPAPLVNEILREVIQNGDLQSRTRAEEYLFMISPESRALHFGAFGRLEGRGSDYGLMFTPFVEGNFHLSDILGASYNYSIYTITDVDGERFNAPGTYSPYPDLVDDTADIGRLKIRQNWTSLIYLGTSNTYVQAGLSRSSIGPFYDNGIVVGPQVPNAGHLSFVYYRPSWSFEMLFQTITASDDWGANQYSNKYNLIHYLTYRPSGNMELGFVQGITWGGRFETMYLVPFSFLFSSQSIFGFEDNAFIGLHLRWRPMDNLLVNTQLYVDDFSFNNIFSGNLEIKAAAMAGITWTPRGSLLSRLDFDYTMVMPYTYSHWNQNELTYQNPPGSGGIPNNLNYTHRGRNLGPDLEPNSDRVSIRTVWNLFPGIALNASGYLMRHGNASLGNPNLSANDHDGSIFDDGWSSAGGRTMLGLGSFLTQSVLDIRVGGGFGVIYTINTNFGTFSVTGDYAAEYGWNRSVRSGEGASTRGGPVSGNNGLFHFWSIGAKWSF